MVTLAPTIAASVTPRPRVEILGVFGAGKTTLASRLTRQFGEMLGERPELNPFWKDSAAHATSGPLAYDLAFLLQHAHLAARAADPNLSGPGVCDWSFITDRLWASFRLGAELEAYDAIHSHLLARLGPPLGYLYLRQPVDVIRSRLLGRGIAAEIPLLPAIPDAASQLEKLICTLPPALVMMVQDDLGGTAFNRQIQAWLKTK